MFSELLSESGLSLDRLESFCRVAQAGGVTKAAKGDPARQSLFSRQIKELEEFFGTDLIRRKGRGIALTEYGARLHTIACDCFAALSDFKSDCRGRPVEVVIGAGESVIQWLLLPRLEELRRRLPNVRLKFLNLPTTEAVKRLGDGTIDFALVRKDAATRPLQTTSLGEITYRLFLPPGLRVAAGPEVNVKALRGIPLATLEGEGSFRTELNALAKKAGITFNLQVECSSFPLLARFVARGNVAAILPNIAEEDLLEAGVNAVALPFLKRFSRPMCLATNARLIRIRPVLGQVAAVLSQLCRF
ncbi:MAG: LysR family transcriptional regulator [Verrucomicrobia bacterium]|nr:LysR family transcriptional regulator [Verrucomicrobiota bacterium]